MTHDEQIKAIAELDGQFSSNHAPNILNECGRTPHLRETILRENGLNYLTSRDAIVPVIEKQSKDVKWAVSENLHDYRLSVVDQRLVWLLATPAQLSEALLRATGKWKD